LINALILTTSDKRLHGTIVCGFGLPSLSRALTHPAKQDKIRLTMLRGDGQAMKRQTGDIVFQADSTYTDLLLRKGVKLRLLESLVFVVGMLLASGFFDTRTTTFKILAFAIAIAVVGLSPFVYKAVLKPRYTLTRTHLIISLAGKERKIPLSEVEPVIEGRHIYKLNGKSESLMVSREFLAHLNERLFYFRKKGKR
jgi:hypothetical protein